IVVVNRAARKLLGYLKKDLLTKNWAAIFNIDEPNFKAILTQITAEGHGAGWVTAIRKGGKTLSCQISLATFADSSNGENSITPPVDPGLQKPRKTPAVLNTLPHLRSNKYQKDESFNAHLAAIVESSEDAIISKSPEGTITSWNKGSEKMFGYLADEVIGKHISILIPPAFLNEEKKMLEKIRNNEIIDHFETVRIKKNGDHFCVSLTVSPLKDSAGVIVGMSKIARDISARKKSEADFIHINKALAVEITEKENRAAELALVNKELVAQNNLKEKLAAALLIANKELELQNNEKEKRAAEFISAISNLKASEQQIIEANKELESFSYSVSHDLRAPLRAINGYTTMLKSRFATQLDPEANRLMNNIVRHANKMGRLIDDLLTFSRVCRRELVKSNVAMHELVTEICSELKNEQGNRNIEFQVSRLLPARADDTAIKQVWVNLISNAVKYTNQKETAVIEISSQAKGNEITYSIKDNGAGFDMRYAGKLFGVFQRLHSDEEFEGTGVGLALVQRIISKHGGRVWAHATVNEGAIFHFTLNQS
ncbi:MAG TPA: PAS domain S-box protein, partial [Flavisolibacter sp.]|nr:PAS domain S-box protein [Flavisolibacter sp.]